MALPAYKEIIDLVRKGATLEAQEKIMELRERSIELQEENIELKEENRRLKDILSRKESLRFINNVYYSVEGDSQDGPFCPTCHDSDSKVIRLHPFNHYVMGQEWLCKVCKSEFPRENS